MKSIKYTLVLALTAFAFNSCTKDVAGPAGTPGQNGPQGASSSYAVTIDSVNASSWRLNAVTSDYDVTIPVSSLTNPNSSIVEVYCATSYNSESTWNELTALNAFTSGDVVTFSYYDYNVAIQYVYTAAPTTKTYFKVVVITQP